ncbi:MAG: methyl-accepting chemotaxis protein [Pseudomonadota bacterium]
MLKKSHSSTRHAPAAPWWALLTRLRMAQRLGLVLGVILLLFLLVAAVGYWGTSSTRTQALTFVDTNLGLSQQVAQVRLNLARSRGFEKDVILFLGDTVSVGKAKALWLAEQKQLDEGLQALSNMLAGNEAATQIDGIKQKIKAYQTRFSGITTQVEMGALDNPMAANRLMRAVNADVDAANAAMNDIVQAVSQQADAAKSQLDTRYSSLLKAGSVIVLLALALAAVLGWAITLSVVTPLKEGIRVAQGIADGRLHEHIDVRGRDEMAALLGALRNMQSSLKATVSGVQASISEISTASSEIAMGNQDLSVRTEHQAGNLQETASNLARLTDTVLQNAASANQAKNLAQDATQVAEDGGRVMGEVVSTMADIKQASDKITDIIAVINDIAFQTNILALNAAVEAARAGEQGRGFAVVAGEVRVLAQRSGSAAKEIAGLIGTSVEQVGQGERRVQAAGDTMQRVVLAIREVADIVVGIASASSAQSASIEQVSKAVGQLDQMTQQNSALVEESAAAAESLREQTVRLTQAMQVFKTAAS